jgi:hypothetical protein
MTVESAPARVLLHSALRKRLSVPVAFTKPCLPATLLACVAVGCALGGCGASDSDARAALTTSAARELAQAQPGSPQSAQSTHSPQLANAFTPAPDATSSNLPDSEKSGAKSGANNATNNAALTALAVRSPASPSADASAQGSQNEPLATPVIHTVD